MKHQYVGDVSDYRKYALLRALSWGGANRIGVCWMLTPSDGRSDGGKLAYLQQSYRYRQFDPQLFDILAHAADEPDRPIQHQEPAVPGGRVMVELINVAARRAHAAMDRVGIGYRCRERRSLQK
ncbi:hypothetical protein EN794_049725 [Mesorhizobium sp. M00.F.Ca.ET.151.01.1.1]|nr:hypothetical protein EN794_049725 [Mesorhizobium sp. M00.F.Ca.ET.151.01.1.1]